MLVAFSAIGFILYTFNSQLVFFLSPTELAERPSPVGKKIRIGGLVEAGSLTHAADAKVSFMVTDMRNTLRVNYTGMLPTLFREGQGVVAEGSLARDGSFTATLILAKHDENYMPPEVADALKKSKHWKTDYPAGGTQP